MRITLNIAREDRNVPDELLTLEIFPDMTVSTLRDSISREKQIPPGDQHIYHNGILISDDSKTMEQLRIGDGELLALHVRDMRGNTGVPETRRANPRQRGMRQDPELMRLQLLGSPSAKAELQRTNPELAAALDDPQRFAEIIRENLEREQRERFERQQLIQGLNDDPFDIEKQRRIEEMIRQERVMENLQNAMEHNPEVFGRVHMLYLDVEINGHRVKAMVDSGAQATVMSPQCAEACGIMRLVDKRFSGIARGVGTANIIGRVHLFQIRIGMLHLPCSFTVMEGKSVDLLLGLDMLKRHQAVIDLAKDKLIIQGVEVPFLGEADIPKELESLEEEPTLPGPAGTTIGQRSGAVMEPTAGPSGAQQVPPAATQRTPAPPPAPAAAAAAPAPAAVPAAAAAPAVAPRAQTISAIATSGFSEEDINKLIALGFSRENAINALQATEGNVELAAGLLFGA